MSVNITDLVAYDYELPASAIAQHPVTPRDHCKLMRLKRKTGEIEHLHFYDLIHELTAHDLLVLNTTRVLPARLLGRKPNGAKIEVLLLKQVTTNHWEALVRPGRRFRQGDQAIFGANELTLTVVAELDEGVRVVQSTPMGDAFFQVIEKIGHVPLPPYIQRPDQPQDRNDYQTVYAQVSGSVAAPTAGLHFTLELLEKLDRQGVKVAPVILHVGLGTFRPVSASDIRDHRMHAEYYSIPAASAEQINQCRQRGGRIVAVGTTTVRTLESAADEFGMVQAGTGWSEIFIYPGYPFKMVDAMITNFHLPKSSLLMMIAAFTSLPCISKAYQLALEHQYRFFSFGDAMFIE
ncbi:tRNA preQ1(34) S-adenosylmethionine ribosyltransferase-isomerase QueA [candidate division KSB1 bacterium]|nr:tRNA preQ1(34) S-adenosylmethionine ribosyltransferase-isomerase QueA [candidate division KSB1 bacterium]